MMGNFNQRFFGCNFQERFTLLFLTNLKFKPTPAGKLSLDRFASTRLETGRWVAHPHFGHGSCPLCKTGHRL